MHEYDITLKRILTREPRGVLARLTGLEVALWHNSELPEVRSQRVDLLGETLDGTLVHIELQSANDSRIALRMLEYALAIERSFGRFPLQLVLYVGQAPLRMHGRVRSAAITFDCRILDIREMDGDALLESGSLDDNIISLLAGLREGLRNGSETVRRILSRIAESDEGRRAEAIAELMIVAGLRSLATVVKGEIERMPILNDIMDHEVFGPKIREALAAGRVEGWVEGRREGVVDGERTLLLGLIQKRFGTLPEWARSRVLSLSAGELEEIAPRVLDAATLEDVLN
jgi:predicted transposase YdaD